MASPRSSISAHDLRVFYYVPTCIKALELIYECNAEQGTFIWLDNKELLKKLSVIHNDLESGQNTIQGNPEAFVSFETKEEVRAHSLLQRRQIIAIIRKPMLRLPFRLRCKVYP